MLLFFNHSLKVMIKPLSVACGHSHSRMTEVLHLAGKHCLCTNSSLFCLLPSAATVFILIGKPFTELTQNLSSVVMKLNSKLFRYRQLTSLFLGEYNC